MLVDGYSKLNIITNNSRNSRQHLKKIYTEDSFEFWIRILLLNNAIVSFRVLYPKETYPTKNLRLSVTDGQTASDIFVGFVVCH